MIEQLKGIPNFFISCASIELIVTKNTVCLCRVYKWTNIQHFYVSICHKVCIQSGSLSAEMLNIFFAQNNICTHIYIYSYNEVSRQYVNWNFAVCISKCENYKLIMHILSFSSTKRFIHALLLTGIVNIKNNKSLCAHMQACPEGKILNKIVYYNYNIIL